MATTGKRAVIDLRLYVAGQSPHSERALANLRAFCRAHLDDRHRLEVIDVLETPARALADRVFLTPQLVITAPPPVRTVIGDLSDPRPLREAIGLGRGVP